MSDLDALTAYLTNSQFSPWADAIAIKVLERFDVVDRELRSTDESP